MSVDAEEMIESAVGQHLAMAVGDASAHFTDEDSTLFDKFLQGATSPSLSVNEVGRKMAFTPSVWPFSNCS